MSACKGTEQHRAMMLSMCKGGPEHTAATPMHGRSQENAAWHWLPRVSPSESQGKITVSLTLNHAHRTQCPTVARFLSCRVAAAEKTGCTMRRKLGAETVRRAGVMPMLA